MRLKSSGGPGAEHVQALSCDESTRQPFCCSSGIPRGSAHEPAGGPGKFVGAGMIEASKNDDIGSPGGGGLDDVSSARTESGP